MNVAKFGGGRMRSSEHWEEQKRKLKTEAESPDGGTQGAAEMGAHMQCYTVEKFLPLALSHVGAGGASRVQSL